MCKGLRTRPACSNGLVTAMGDGGGDSESLNPASSLVCCISHQSFSSDLKCSHPGHTSEA